MSGLEGAPSSCALQLFLSLTSLFNAHLLPRALSTSPETLFTTLALVLFPLPRPETPVAVVIGDGQLVASKSMRDVTRAEDADLAQIRPTDGVRLKDVGEINYVVMDRIGPDVVARERCAPCLPRTFGTLKLQRLTSSAGSQKAFSTPQPPPRSPSVSGLQHFLSGRISAASTYCE